MMKKSVLRVGLLVLTLALLLGALTLTAGATGTTAPTDGPSLRVTPGKTELVLEPGERYVSTSITVQAPTGYELAGEPVFSPTANVDGADGYYIFSATQPGTYLYSVTASCKQVGEEGEGGTISLSGSCSIEVKAPQQVSAFISGPNTVKVDEHIDLAVGFSPATAANQIEIITWSSSNRSIATVDNNGQVIGKAAGPVTITATLQSKTPAFTLTSNRVSYDITVTGGRYTVEDPRSVSLYAGHGPSNPPELTVWDEDGNRERDFDVVWTSDKTSIVSVNSAGKLVPHKKGNATLTAEVTVNGETVRTDCRVDVENDEIRFDTFQLEEGDTKTLSATLKSGVKTGVTFTFESSDDDGLDVYKRSYSSNTYTAKAEECGVYTITVEATLPDGKTKLETDVDVSVYRDEDIDVTLAKADDFDFDQKDVFSAVKAGSYTYPTRDLDDLRMDELLLDGCSDFAETFTIDPVRQSNPAGSLSGISGSHRNISSLGYVSFDYDSRGGDTLVAEYYIYGDDELLLKTGTLTISTDGTSSDGITYETDNSTDVIFKEEDFEDFWERETGEDADTLDYVVFRPSSSDWGTLYTTSTKKDEVTRSMKFEPNYKTSSKNYDLDKVTYEPDEDKLTTYTDTIEFTAYGTDGDTEVDGTVLIQLNSSAGTVITSRGVVFGKGNLTKLLEETFAQNRDADLAYVQFYLPDPEEGKLYYNFSKVLTSSEVSSREYYYVDPEKKQPDLDLVAFVPAAETYGKVTLYYKGFDETGDIDYNGTLTLSVKQKTSSAAFTDVNSKSYSWASDAVDFLYYEEIAQGSGGKYNPSSSITRGDFMLMLYRAFLEEAYEDYTPKTNFSDVVKGTSSYSKETYQAVGVAKYLGIAQGSGGKFKPNSPITREEAMTLIYRTLDEIDWELSYEADARASSFTDYGTISSYAKTAITDLVSHGVILGSNGKISPKSNITRAEMACILHRVLTY